MPPQFGCREGWEAGTKWSSVLICAFSSVEKSVINQQRTIDFPAQYQPESSVSDVTINKQHVGSYPAAAMPLAFSNQIIQRWDPELPRVMAG